jgi:hypothetical protein
MKLVRTKKYINAQIQHDYSKQKQGDVGVGVDSIIIIIIIIASDMGTINSSDRIAATFYFLGTWFVSGIYV